ncbi:hypothetical protein [Kosakonia sacchari]|uniref:Uncharacterized protein n=1 Tax=Kosakonia sacchari TaxID=1158459 RepID=A0ABZ0MSP6_9ENTR|nr:hypothetical protein [Kosakonia sacchari]WOZ78499.1 hypothetical protein Q8Y70_05380 [Kosakonia sacchari]
MTSGWALSEGVEPTDELLDLIKEVSSVSILAGAGQVKQSFLLKKLIICCKLAFVRGLKEYYVFRRKKKHRLILKSES